MSNFEQKFKNWQERMNAKSEKEKHNYAITVSIIVTAIVTFFVASSWYYRISGESLNTSFFTEVEEFLASQKGDFFGVMDRLSETKNIFLNTEK
jgi:PDZ domain-containing secreted protein